MATWSVIARNLPEHARNAIHTDAGAHAAGFPRALVAGVTTYAYLTHPPMVTWGLDWVRRGGGEVRFRRPVFDGDTVRCTPRPDDVHVVDALTDEVEQPRATFALFERHDHEPTLRPGELLPTQHIALSGEWGSDYGLRAGDPLTLCSDHGIVHPAVWPALANHMVHTKVARGSWIHTRSIVRHHAMAPTGAIADVQAHVVRRFDSHGERAVLDVVISVEGIVVASLEHEAIVALTG